VVVELTPVKALKRPETLDEMKKHKRFSGMKLLRQSRLSVSPVSEDEFDAIVALGSQKN
jgi:predicted RNA-binding protein with PUA-like domain